MSETHSGWSLGGLKKKAIAWCLFGLVFFPPLSSQAALILITQDGSNVRFTITLPAVMDLTGFTMTNPVTASVIGGTGYVPTSGGFIYAGGIAGATDPAGVDTGIVTRVASSGWTDDSSNRLFVGPAGDWWLATDIGFWGGADRGGLGTYTYTINNTTLSNLGYTLNEEVVYNNPNVSDPLTGEIRISTIPAVPEPDSFILLTTILALGVFLVRLRASKLSAVVEKNNT